MSLDYLQKKNSHPRDSFITFDEGPHIYTIKGDSNFLSVTTWNHSHFEKFNADKIIKNMMASKNWKNSKYYGMSSNEIKELWNNNKNEAASAGTKMHYDIECFYNKIKVENKSIEYKYFNNFLKDYKHLKPYRTEWMVYDENLKLAGSIDMVYKNKDGSLLIYDWKRCKEIKKINKWKNAKTKCISHLPDTNFWHYALQLNTYKYILEKNYGKEVKELALICLHPENKNKNFIKYKVPILSKEIKDLMDLRLGGINKEYIIDIKKKITSIEKRCEKIFRSLY